MSVLIVIFICYFVEAALANVLMEHVKCFDFGILSQLIFVWKEEAVLSIVYALILFKFIWTKLAVECLDPRD